MALKESAGASTPSTARGRSWYDWMEREVASGVDKQPKAGETKDGSDEVEITGHATAAAAADHRTGGDQEATPFTPSSPTIGQRNQTLPRDRSANSEEARMATARMATARLAGQQRQKKHRPRSLPALREEDEAGAAPGPAEDEQEEEDEQEDEQEDGYLVRPAGSSSSSSCQRGYQLRPSRPGCSASAFAAAAAATAAFLIRTSG